MQWLGIAEGCFRHAKILGHFSRSYFCIVYHINNAWIYVKILPIFKNDSQPPSLIDRTQNPFKEIIKNKNVTVDTG